MKHKLSNGLINGWRELALDEKLSRGDVFAWNQSVFMFHSGMIQNVHQHDDFLAFLKGHSYVVCATGVQMEGLSPQELIDSFIHYYKEHGLLAKSYTWPTGYAYSVWRKGPHKLNIIKHPWQTQPLPLP